MSRALAYKYRLILTDSEKRELDRLFAISRKCWNFYVEQWDTFPREVKSKERHKEVRRRYNAYLAQEENQWQKVLNKRYLDYITKAVDAAWSKFFKALDNNEVAAARKKYLADYKMKKEAGVKIKWNQKKYDSFYKPKFKSCFDDASINTDVKGSAKIDLQNGLFWFNKKSNPLNFRIKSDDKIFNYDIEKFYRFTLSKTKAGKYFLSANFEGTPKTSIVAKPGVVGVDLGCKDFAVLSDGSIINMPDEKLKRLKVRIKHLQLKLSRQWLRNNENKDWNKKNWRKTKLKIAKLHEKVANIRLNATHNFTNVLTSNYSLIGIEDLNVKGMTKKSKAKLGEDGKTFVRNNKKQKAGLNRSILNKNFYEVKRQVKYKSEWKDGLTILAEQYYPSSKTCNSCGHKTTLKLSDRIWDCPSCGSVNDRDFNAAKNLRDNAIREVSKTPEVKQNVLNALATGKGSHLATIYGHLSSVKDWRKLTTRDRRLKHRKTPDSKNTNVLIIKGLYVSDFQGVDCT